MVRGPTLSPSFHCVYVSSVTERGTFRPPAASVPGRISQILHFKGMFNLGIVFLDLKVHHSTSVMIVNVELFISQVTKYNFPSSKCSSCDPLSWQAGLGRRHVCGCRNVWQGHSDWHWRLWRSTWARRTSGLTRYHE